MRPEFSFPLCYGILSMVAYALVFDALWKRRKQISADFRIIYTFSSIVNILTFINTALTVRLPKYYSNDEWAVILYLSLDKTIASTMYFLITYFYYIQASNIMLLSFNRFTCIALPSMTGDQSSHRKFWARSLKFLILAIILIPLCIQIPMSLSSQFKLVNGSLMNYSEEMTRHQLRIEYFAELFFAVFVVSISLTFNLLTVFYFKYLKIRVPLVIDFYIYAYAIGNSILMAIMTGFLFVLYMNFVYFHNREVDWWISLSLPFVSDLLTLADPYILFIFNKKIREEVLGQELYHWAARKLAKFKRCRRPKNQTIL